MTKAGKTFWVRSNKIQTAYAKQQKSHEENNNAN